MSEQSMETDVLFLIYKYLTNIPDCKQLAEGLKHVLETKQETPKRLDSNGQVQSRNVNDWVNASPLIPRSFLEDAVKNIMKSSKSPSIFSQNIFDSIYNQKEARNRKTSGKTVSLLQKLMSSKKSRGISYSTLNSSGINQPSINYRETGLFAKLRIHKRIVGHMSHVLHVEFDRKYERIFTGSDDNLVKCWCTKTGRLIQTFRGLDCGVLYISISQDNRVLAVAGRKKYIKIWALQTGRSIAILRGHTALITGMAFSPFSFSGISYLASTGDDCNVFFYQMNDDICEFEPRPIVFGERSRPSAKLTYSQWSKSGRFFAAACTDANIILFYISEKHKEAGPTRLGELHGHSAKVEVIEFAFRKLQLLSVSNDGLILIWEPKSKSVSNCVARLRAYENTKTDIATACWSGDDKRIVSTNDNGVIKIWCAITFRLMHRIEKAHKTKPEICMAVSTEHPNLIFTAGWDGFICIIDIIKSKVIQRFENTLAGHDNPAIFSLVVSPDCRFFTAVDSFGHIILGGLGEGKKGIFETLPNEMFFHTDYNSFISRENNTLQLDEIQQVDVDQMEPPWLVDSDFKPYAPELQRLVPSRAEQSDMELTPTCLPMSEGHLFLVDPVRHVPHVLNRLKNKREESIFQRIRELEATITPEELESIIDTNSSESTQNLNNSNSNTPPPISDNLNRKIYIFQTEIILDKYDRHPYLKMPIVRKHVETEQEKLLARTLMDREVSEYKIDKYVDQTWLLGSDMCQSPVKPVMGSTVMKTPLTKRIEGNTVNAPTQQLSETQSASANQSATDQELANSLASRSLRSVRRLRFDPERSNRNYGTRSAVGIRRSGSGNASVRNTRQNTELDHSYDDVNDVDFIVEDNSTENNRNRPRRRGFNSSGNIPEELQTSTMSEEEEEEEEDNGHSTSEDEDADSVKTENSINRSNFVKTKTKGLLLPPCLSIETNDAGDFCMDRSGSRNAKRTRNRDETNGSVPSSPKRIKKSDSKSDTDEDIFADEPVFKQDALPIVMAPEVELTDWFTSTVTTRCQYQPQLLDKVVYFRTGHQKYMQNCFKTAHKVGRATLERMLNPVCKVPLENLSFAERAKVKSIRYCSVPLRLCTIELELVDHKEAGTENNETLELAYHDIDNGSDFLILKDHYDSSVEIFWDNGETVRTIIDEKWWYGVVEENNYKTVPNESMERSSSEDSDSEEDENPFKYDDEQNEMFEKIRVKWDDTGSLENVSLWDIYKCPPGQESIRVTEGYDGSENMTEQDRKHYLLIKDEWKHKSIFMNDFTKVMLEQLEKIMKIDFFDDFKDPVDYLIYTDYLPNIGYPTHLTQIHERLKNGFYRSFSGLKWEIDLLHENTKRYNDPKSEIIENCERLVGWLKECMRKTLQNQVDKINIQVFIASLPEYAESDDKNDDDFETKSDDNEKIDGGEKHSSEYKSSDDDSESGSDKENGKSSKRRISKHVSRKKSRQQKSRSKTESDDSFELVETDSIKIESKPDHLTNEWAERAWEFVNILKLQEYSQQFLEPVSRKEYPEYYKMIKSPICMKQIITKLKRDNGPYKFPHDIIRDIQTLVNNACTFTPSPKNRIHINAQKVAKALNDNKAYLLRGGREITLKIPNVVKKIQVRKRKSAQKSYTSRNRRSNSDFDSDDLENEYYSSGSDKKRNNDRARSRGRPSKKFVVKDEQMSSSSEESSSTEHSDYSD